MEQKLFIYTPLSARDEILKLVEERLEYLLKQKTIYNISEISFIEEKLIPMIKGKVE